MQQYFNFHNKIDSPLLEPRVKTLSRRFLQPAAEKYIQIGNSEKFWINNFSEIQQYIL